MKKFLPIFLLVCGSLSAALPPLWQNVAELKAILEDKELGATLQSGDAIESIEKTENGWVIKTNHRTAKIEVKVEPAKMPGPAKFTLQWSII